MSEGSSVKMWIGMSEDDVRLAMAIVQGACNRYTRLVGDESKVLAMNGVLADTIFRLEQMMYLCRQEMKNHAKEGDQP